ncbi:MAG: CGNR zinc finger domain-containing protein [Acidipropionibacterium acidipropionici]|jgi:hypothetical protein|uniref:CGNR zinc finger domain-containing protein n=1 Tax=Acidipropionibacterium acidipropionici TaxID=1748 RepID=UPI002F3578F0
MRFSHDIRANLLMLVDLLNTAPRVCSPRDGLASPGDLTSFVTRHDFTGPLVASTFDVAAVATLRERFRVALDDDVEPVVEAINLTFAEIRAFPHLMRHGDWDWHVHAAADSAPLGERVASDIALVLTGLVRSGDLSRLRRCAAPDCSAALADLTRNGSKRFCDARNCANRVHVAAYRARHTQ